MNPICFALDVPDAASAQRLTDLLSDHVGAFKVGLELFIASGKLPATDKPVVLDLKLHDIPETVGRAVRVGGDLGVKYMTLHIQQQGALEAALKAAEPFGITLLGVTVLTSMTMKDCEDLRYNDPTCNPSLRARYLARFAWGCGLRGFVCSPQEVGALHKDFPGTFLVPGIRPAGDDVGDQKRVGTPEQAVKDGADLIVIGRPIRDAKDPVTKAKEILASVGVP